MSIVFWMSTIGRGFPSCRKSGRPNPLFKTALACCAEALERWASGLPDFDVDYVGAALTILHTALEVKNYYVERF